MMYLSVIILYRVIKDYIHACKGVYNQMNQFKANLGVCFNLPSH